jgi:transcriptional regulator with XRE-family HTH domain
MLPLDTFATWQYGWAMADVETKILLKGVELVFAHMKRTGENQAAIARRCGLTPATLSRICAGTRRPDFDAARKLRDGIGIPFDAWHEPASKIFQRKFVDDAA